MNTNVKKTHSPLLRKATSKFLRVDPQQAQKDDSKLTTIDGFDLKLVPNKLSQKQFAKITKAMRQQVEAGPNAEGVFELGQAFKLADLATIKNLTKEQLEHAYLEGVYVAERYCALVDPGESSIQSNAKRFMADYLDYLHHPMTNRDEIEWVKKDYKAGTAGEDVEADALLVKRAKRFSKRVHRLDAHDGVAHVQHQTKRLLEKDDNALTAFIALRRATFV